MLSESDPSQDTWFYANKQEHKRFRGCLYRHGTSQSPKLFVRRKQKTLSISNKDKTVSTHLKPRSHRRYNRRPAGELRNPPWRRERQGGVPLMARCTRRMVHGLTLPTSKRSTAKQHCNFRSSPIVLAPPPSFLSVHLVVAEAPSHQAQAQEPRHPHSPGDVRRRRAFRLALPTFAVFPRRRRHRHAGGLRQSGRIVRATTTSLFQLRLLLGGLVHRLHLDAVGAWADAPEQQGAPVLP